MTYEEVGDRWVVKAVYPLDESRKYFYPRRAEADELPWFLAWLDIGGSSFKYDNREVRVVSQPGGGALTLYADTGSGDVRIRQQKGDVKVDTGSGDIRLEQVVAGKIDVDTGSGDVTLRAAP